MKIKFIILLFLFSVYSSEAQDIKILDFNKLEPRLHASNDTVYLINFWATWCKPCTEEIPDFVRVNKELADKNFKMIFVSLDLPASLDTRLKNFIRDHKMEAEVVLLDDPDFNSWINKVDRSWEGSIPATLMYYPGKRKFVEGSLDYEKIMKFVEPGLK